MLTYKQRYRLSIKGKEAERRYFQKHKEKISLYRHGYYIRKKDEQLTYSGQYYRKNRKRILQREKDRYRSDSEVRKRKQFQGKKDKKLMRDKILELLGNKCRECGWTDPRALQIDHVNGGGHLHRLANSSWSYYKRILEEVLAGNKDYQLLCANHNAIKRISNREVGKKFVGSVDE